MKKSQSNKVACHGYLNKKKSIIILDKYLEKWKIHPFNSTKLNFQKIKKGFHLFMVKGPLNPNITSLGEQL